MSVPGYLGTPQLQPDETLERSHQKVVRALRNGLACPPDTALHHRGFTVRLWGLHNTRFAVIVQAIKLFPYTSLFFAKYCWSTDDDNVGGNHSSPSIHNLQGPVPRRAVLTGFLEGTQSVRCSPSPLPTPSGWRPGHPVTTDDGVRYHHEQKPSTVAGISYVLSRFDLRARIQERDQYHKVQLITIPCLLVIAGRLLGTN